MITIRASSSDRVLTCNGSLTLEPLVAKRKGDDGDEGTMIHYLIARRLIEEFGAVPPEGGLPPPEVPKAYKLPANAYWIVEWALRHVRETIPADWSLMVEAAFAYEFLFDVPVSATTVEWVNGNPVIATIMRRGFILSGHTDVKAISPDGTKSIGIDWKTGRDPVDPAESNEQVACYIVLGGRAWETLTESMFQIAQPRVTEDDEFERISTVVVKDIPALTRSVVNRVRAALENSMEVNSGLKQCRWCPVGMQCKAMRQLLEKMKATLTPEDLLNMKPVPNDALLGDWIVAMRTLEPLAKKAKEVLHERLDKVPLIVSGEGVQISRKIQGGSYSIPDPVAFLAAARTVLTSEESIARSFTPSITRIKDEIAAVMDIPKTSSQGNSAEAVFDGLLRPLVEQGEKKMLVFR